MQFKQVELMDLTPTGRRQVRWKSQKLPTAKIKIVK